MWHKPSSDYKIHGLKSSTVVGYVCKASPKASVFGVLGCLASPRRQVGHDNTFALLYQLPYFASVGAIKSADVASTQRLFLSSTVASWPMGQGLSVQNQKSSESPSREKMTQQGVEPRSLRI